jgi:hypothetical protein
MSWHAIAEKKDKSEDSKERGGHTRAGTRFHDPGMAKTGEPFFQT